jgi:hypothetical protein
VVEVILLFPEHDDVAALDGFLSRLVITLRTAHGCRSVRLSTGSVMSRSSRSPYVRVVEATFDSLAAWMDAVPKPDLREERELFDRFDPVVLFFEALEGGER